MAIFNKPFLIFTINQLGIKKMSRAKNKKQSMPQKVLDAQKRNEFLAHLKVYFKEITGDDEIYKLIPKSELERIYLKRYRPIKVRAGKDQKIEKDVIEYCQEQFIREYKENFIELNVGSLESISYHDYFSIGYTIAMYQRTLNVTTFKGASKVKDALFVFAEKMNPENSADVWKRFAEFTETLAIYLSHLSSGLCVIKNIKIDEANYSGFGIEISEAQTNKRHLTVKGETRIAYQVAWVEWKITLLGYVPFTQFLSINGEKLGISDKPNLEVFIQTHALDRLSERMDDMNEGVLHINLFISVKETKYCRTKGGDLLIEYRIFEEKTGYFLAEIIDGVLLLKTFLFLTNNGTPEGEVLHQNTGLMKEDKKYLKIDKISAFLNSDIATNDRVKQIFIDAGCESLFKVDKQMYLGEVDKQKNLADLVLRHLKRD